MASHSSFNVLYKCVCVGGGGGGGVRGVQQKKKKKKKKKMKIPAIFCAILILYPGLKVFKKLFLFHFPQT